MCAFVSSRPDATREDDSSLLQRKSVRVLLQGNRSLEGTMHIPQGQSLVRFLGLKKHFLNLTEVRWLDGRHEAEPLSHLSIRISQIVWVVPLDGTFPLSSAANPFGGQRKVELHLVGGLTVEVTLGISDEQRMSDYFDSNTAFVPLRSALVAQSQEVIERLAVNHESILAIREI